MTRTIPHRELRNNSSAVLRDVQRGEQVQISNHGEVVAMLVPADRSAGAMLRVRPARVRGGFESVPKVRVGRPVREVLDELRGDR